MSENADGRRWWHGAVIYQLYVRSWRDSNEDGYGDLRGIIERLDYLSQLGVDAVWLSPTMPSPDDDWGYDVSDYTGVHPELGTLADLDELIEQAGQRGMRVLLDLALQFLRLIAQVGGLTCAAAHVAIDEMAGEQHQTDV
jgi:1,4-alpha-glucan branching enzyme